MPVVFGYNHIRRGLFGRNAIPTSEITIFIDASGIKVIIHSRSWRGSSRLQSSHPSYTLWKILGIAKCAIEICAYGGGFEVVRHIARKVAVK